MEGVYEELDEEKAEMDKLKEECCTKMELSESLRKVHNEQLVKYQEAKLQMDKQAQELNDKAEEISELRQKYEDLNRSLHEKESFLRHLSSANEKLKDDFGEKLQTSERENKELVLALDEAAARNQDFERKICASDEEIEGLKRLLSVAEKKCLETEQKAQNPKELKLRDDLILKLEEECSNAQDRLKWKNEQFEHLEEAHERLHGQFQSSKVEWDREKSMLLEEIRSLQASLDSQVRISESLSTQLKMCNQALAHEESRRKMLEVEVSELKSRFENVFLECQEAKSKIEEISLKRDDEIAELRNSLGMKETLFKEMEYKIAHLEEENQEFRGSLKELREAQINKSGANCSSKKLQNKLRVLEQLHGRCSLNLTEKEAEWSSQMEKMKGDMDICISDLKGKDKKIEDLEMELEGCYSSLEVRDVEISFIIMVLISEFSEAYSKLSNLKSVIGLRDKVREEKILLLTDQLEIKDNAQQKLEIDLEHEHKKVASLMERVESFDLMKQQQVLMEEELEKKKKILQESLECQSRLKEENSEWAKKINEVNKKELELQKWKSISEDLKVHLEENQEVLKREKESLLGVVKEQDEKIGDLQQQIVFLGSVIATKTEAVEAYKEERENSLRIVEDKDSRIENLQKEINALCEALDKAENLKKLEVQEKDKIMTELEKEASDSLQKLMLQDEQLTYLKQQVEQLETLMEAKKLEMERLNDHVGNEQRCLEGRVKELESEKEVLFEDIVKLSSGREDLLVQFEGICDRVCNFSDKDVELMGILEKILQNSGESGLNNCSRENLNIPLSPPGKGIEESIDQRLPLRELNG